MALVFANRVQETTTTTGTGTITLAGAVSGYQSFLVIGDANTTYYTITSGAAWEVGIGTYTLSGTTLARTTILSSSAAGAAIALTGTSTVFVTYPSEKAIADGYGILPVLNGGTGVTTSTGTGSVVLSNSPTFVSPVLGNPAATRYFSGAGSVGSPAFSFTGNSNIGMWSPAANVLAFSTNSLEVMRFDASNNVGIGNTPSGTYKLEVTGAVSASSMVLGAALPVASGGSGAVTLTGILVGNGTSAFTAVTAPSGAIVGTTDTQTLTNKRITPRVSSTASITSPLAWNSDSFDEYAATAQAAALTISADAGTPTDGQKAIFRFLDNATPRVITFTGGVSKGFRPVGATLTVSSSNFTYTTTASKTVYFGCVYNAAAARWDVIALSQEV